MKVVVTCGPSYEPVDEVRRLTNFSTGELGMLLSEQLVSVGFETVCLRGVAATDPAKPLGVSIRPFTTNDGLASQLQALVKEGPVLAVFHAAALCDYRVRRVLDSGGREVGGAKIASRAGALTIELEPASKLIVQMRDWFPESFLVGWKYELDGAREDAIAKAQKQLLENRTDLCVVNGRAYGDGFGLLAPDGSLLHETDKRQLCLALSHRLLGFKVFWHASRKSGNYERPIKSGCWGSEGQ